MKLPLNKEQAKEFLQLQETGDILGLEYLKKFLTGEIEGPSKFPYFFSYVINAALELNAAIIMMEQGTTKYNGNIDTAYREIMCELVESARAVCEYEV